MWEVPPWFPLIGRIAKLERAVRELRVENAELEARVTRLERKDKDVVRLAAQVDKPVTQ